VNFRDTCSEVEPSSQPFRFVLLTIIGSLEERRLEFFECAQISLDQKLNNQFTMESPSALDFLESFADHSTAPHGVHGVIPAEQGRALIDEHDEDVSKAGHELNALLTQAYSVSQSHMIALKKRLLEEKHIEMLEVERKYLNHVDSLKNEIQQLQQEISNQATELGDSRQSKEDFNLKAAVALSKGSVKYSHPYSVLKVFQAWREEIRSTRRANKLDKVARTFVRKYTLSRAFSAMVLNSHVRKANKQNAEAKFKFDSVTTEVSTFVALILFRVFLAFLMCDLYNVLEYFKLQVIAIS